MAAPNPVRIIPSIGGNLRAGGEYVIRDEFTTDRAAGAVHGTAAEPGPGTRTVTDTESNLTIAGGALTFAGGKASPAWSDPGMWLNAVARVPGRIVVLSETESATNKLHAVGFSNRLFGEGNANDFHVSAAGAFYAQDTALQIAGFPYSATTYHLSVVLRTAGAFYFVKGGALTYWTLMFVGANNTTTPIYPYVAGYSAAFTLDALHVPLTRWLPTPLLSDGFGSAYGTSDGLGHAEGVAGGIGAGGSGVTLSNVGGTWSVSGGKAINTPATFTPVTVTNGTFDSNTSGWTASGGGVLASVPNGQSGNCLEVTNSAANYGYAAQYLSIPAGTWVRQITWIKSGTSGIALLVPSNGTILNYATSRASWTRIPLTWRSPSASIDIRMGCSSSTLGLTTTVDSVSVDSMVLSELVSVANLACADVLAGAAVTRGGSALASGLAVSWDSPSSPANGVLIYLLGTNIIVDKYVAGVWSNVSSTAYTYSAGARLVVSKNGTEYRTYYNNALVKADTIADAGIISNTFHGLFSTDSSSSMDDLCIYAIGTSGEYAALDAF